VLERQTRYAGWPNQDGHLNRKDRTHCFPSSDSCCHRPPQQFAPFAVPMTQSYARAAKRVDWSAGRELTRGGLCLALLMVGSTAHAQGELPEEPSINGPTPSSSVASPGPEPGPSGSIAPLLNAPSVLPATGIGPSGPDVRIGNLGNQLTLPLGEAPLEPSAGRAWTIVPSVAISEEYVAGALGPGSAAVSNQLVTVLQPGVSATGDTLRLHGEVFYDPQITIYSRDGSQDQIAQDFNGRLLATLAPQTLYLDLRGFGSEQAITPGQPVTGTSVQARGNTTQIYNLSATPYAIHRFDDWGTGEIGATISSTVQSALQVAANQPGLEALSAASNQNVTAIGGHLAFVTGEAFARFNSAFLAQETSFDGTGVLHGAYRRTVTFDNGYALTRTIVVLATIGWESTHYSGIPGVVIDDAIWNVGVRVTPNAKSSITIRYGHQDGLNSFMLDAGYQLTAHTSLYARYSKGLTTTAEQLQTALATTDLNALGNPVDQTTGAPLVPVGTFFGINSGLYKTTLASVTVAWTRNRDILSASVNTQSQTLVSASNLVTIGTASSSGAYGTLTWSHELRPNLQSTAYVQYGTTSGGVLTSGQQLIAASVALSYALSPTLAGRAQYTSNQQSGANGGTQQLFLIGLAKSF